MTKPNSSVESQVSEPLVSILMNCYNGEKFLREAIDSVLAQTHQNWEIVFWDNASEDASGAIAQSYGDHRIKYFRSECNRPLGHARNEAFAKARGELIAFLDTDDIWYPAKLSSQVAFFRQHPELDFLYTNLRHRVQDSQGRWVDRKKVYLFPQPSGRVFHKFLKQCPVNLQTVMVRHSLLRGLGELFDETFHVAEEFDLFMRIFHDRPAGYLPDALVAYRLHPDQDSKTKIGLYAAEGEQILKKLQQLFPESNEKYKKEYDYYKAKINYYHARLAMRLGDREKARALLRPFRWMDWRFGLLYGLLSLPGRAFVWAHYITGRYS